MEVVVAYWLEVLELTQYDVQIVGITRDQVMFPDDIEKKEKYYVGLFKDPDILYAEIIHDRELTEEDIVHELLHLKFPSVSEDGINLLTRLVLTD